MRWAGHVARVCFSRSTYSVFYIRYTIKLKVVPVHALEDLLGRIESVAPLIINLGNRQRL
jgi:hypothetical protein